MFIGIFVAKIGEGTGNEGKIYIYGLHDLCLSSDIIKMINQGEVGGKGMLHAWKKREMRTQFYVESPKE
jgi:hypothetical protein